MDKAIRILILEDNPADVDLIEFELQEAGLNFTSQKVMTKKDYVRQLQEFCPDVILSDYDLPQFSGALALKEAKKNYPEVPFILVTGAISEDRAIDILTSGAKDYVMKNRLQRLVPAIERALEEVAELKARNKAEEELREAHKTLESKIKKRTAKLRAEIQERRRTEKALRESEERYSTTLTSIGDAVIATDNKGKITFMNKVAEELTGWQFRDAIQKPVRTVFTIINEFTRHEVESPINKVLETGSIIGLARHTILIRKDRSEVAIDDSGAPINDRKGNIVGVVLVFRDMTESKKREGKLDRLNRTLKALSNSKQAMIRSEDEAQYLNEVCRIIVEDCGHAMVWIGLAENNEAKSVRPVVSAGFEEGYLETLKISWEDNERGRGPTGTAIRTGKPASCGNMLTDPQFQPWRKEAIKRGYASSLVLPLLSEDKSFGALTIYSRLPDSFSEDEIQMLSELADDLAYGIMTFRLREDHDQAGEVLKKRTLELEAANNELESFSYSVSHDLRAPLRAIEGFSRMLVRDSGRTLDDQSTRKLNSIVDNTVKMNQLIEDLLSLSRLGRQEMKMAVIKMENVAREAWDEIQESPPRDNLKFKTVNIPDGYGDYRLIKQVLINLFSNAMKFTRGKNNALIELRCKEEPDENIYCVTDNGTGFDMEYYHKLFGVFQRLHAAEEYEGTGVGLSIVKRIIERHGGHVWAEGKVDEGATFYFSLPRASN